MTADTFPHALERLNLPAALDGRHGSNRASSTATRLLAADTDLAAVQQWLAEYAGTQTERHYRKEAERLLLWAWTERGKALSDLSREDCLAYEAFLADPQPRARWCGPKAPRYSPQWRPFLGPLTAASRRSALVIINALFSYLVAGGYLAGNPLALARRRSVPPPPGVERYLEQPQWQALLETIETLPQTTARERAYYERSRFLLALLYLLGPRLHEIAQATMNSFVEVRGRWWWRVTGKGGRTARVPVTDELREALSRYRQFYGLPPLPPPDDTGSLLRSLNGTRGIHDSMIYRLVKALVQQAAGRLETSDPAQAALLRKASTHWLRHTSITHQAAAGIDLTYVQRNARHARLDTTGLYLHAEEGDWHAAMQKHRLRPDKP